MIISERGREYRQAVMEAVADATPTTQGAGDGTRPPPRIGLLMNAWPPDNRRRDLDNLGKAPLDALTRAGIYADDSQIDLLTYRRRMVCPGGKLQIRLFDMAAQDVCPCCGHYLTP